MKCIAIRHLKFEDLGTFEEVLISAGFGIEYLDAGTQRLESSYLNEADLVVVLGGPIGVYERDKYPWLKNEIAVVAERVHQNLPTLGICLGAQIIAAALGAKVYPGKAKEIGWSSLQLSEAGKTSCLNELDQIDVLHWHGDTFDLPVGGLLLASTDLTPNQAFSYGSKILALQFHAEAHGDQTEPWLIGHAVELGLAGIDIPLLRQASLNGALIKASAGQKMFLHWLQEAIPLRYVAGSKTCHTLESQ